MRISILPVIFIFIFGQLSAQEAPPPNDACEKAIELFPGQMESYQSNDWAKVAEGLETPETMETTCIKTLENDMWYKFKTMEDYEFYEVVIAMNMCNTPAGLQAILIQSDNCDRTEYVYRACSNKENTDTIKLYLHAKEAGIHHLIYVDGYDGTVCNFNIWLNARESIEAADYRFTRYDYELSEPPSWSPTDFRSDFVNNAARICWSAETSEDITLFVVELLPELSSVDEDSRYARVVGLVRPSNLVASGKTDYEFVDYITPFRDGEDYEYRIVAIDGKGGRSVTEDFSINAKLVTDFHVSEIIPGTDSETFVARYINKKKNQRYDLYVLDEQMQEVKHLVFEKEPVREGTVTINMAGFDPGTYYFKMDSGKGFFLRQFMK